MNTIIVPLHVYVNNRFFLMLSNYSTKNVFRTIMLTIDFSQKYTLGAKVLEIKSGHS
jgi:hypothetical protein